jgi:hypothetical protein
MSWLKRTGTVLLILLVLLSTTGINVYRHICACAIVNAAAKGHSCCRQPAPEDSCCQAREHHGAREDSPATGCANHHKGCRTASVYLKASLLALPASPKVMFPQILFPLLTGLSYGDLTPGLPEAASFVPSCTGSPPLLAGRQLVTYLHQIRIPFAA